MRRPPPSFPSLAPPTPPPPADSGNLGMRGGWRRWRGGGAGSGILGVREPSEPGEGGRVRQVSPPPKHHHFGSFPVQRGRGSGTSTGARAAREGRRAADRCTKREQGRGERACVAPRPRSSTSRVLAFARRVARMVMRERARMCAFCSKGWKLGVILRMGDLCGKTLASKAAILLLARAPLSPFSANTTFAFSCSASSRFRFHPLPCLHHGRAVY